MTTLTDRLTELQFFCLMAAILAFGIAGVVMVIVWPLGIGPRDPDALGFTVDELNRITRAPPAHDPLRRSFAKRIGGRILLVVFASLPFTPRAAASPSLAIVVLGTGGHHPLLVLIAWALASWIAIGALIWLALGGPARFTRDCGTRTLQWVALKVVANWLTWPSIILKGLRS